MQAAALDCSLSNLSKLGKGYHVHVLRGWKLWVFYANVAWEITLGGMSLIQRRESTSHRYQMPSVDPFYTPI